MAEGDPCKHSECVRAGLRMALVAVVLVAHLSGAVGGPIDQPKGGSKDEADEGQIFSLIDWGSYKRMFNKDYSSLTQQLLRQQIFLSNNVKVFLAGAKYRLHNSGYYLKINKFSDLTPEEERRKLSGDGGDYPSDDEDDDPMDDEQVKETLLRALKKGATEDEQATGQEVTRQEGPLSRHKRSTTPSSEGLESRRALSVRDLVQVPGSQLEPERAKDLKIKWVVPSNNPDYEPVDFISLGLDSDMSRGAERVEDIPEHEIDDIQMSALTWLSVPITKIANALSFSLNKSIDWFRSNSMNGRMGHESVVLSELDESVDKVRSAAPQPRPRPYSANDRVTVDWRDSGCIAPPMDQGRCQSCYAISSMAFLEWAFCMNQKRALTPLSVQYMVSCGSQFKREADPSLKINFNGCHRGRSRQAMYFVKEYGIELAAHMPYLGRDTECPVRPKTPLKSKGYIRPNVMKHVRMAANTTQLELALKVGPVIVNFREPVDFLAYGGGMVDGCYQMGGHAMLIVGHGIENEIPYLIIKNSFGTDWGMGGYFKFNRKYTTECIKDFILPRVSFPSKKAQARRAKAYLADQQKDPITGEVATTPDEDRFFAVDAAGLFSSR